MDFQKNQPSVKLHHAPGGQSNFSLAWDDGSSQQKPKQATAVTSPFATHEEEKKQAHTSVKYSGQAPGGQTSISLSDGSTSYNHFQTQNQANSAFVGAGTSTLPSAGVAAGKSTNNASSAVPPGGRSQITF